jgi:hypothetical protein
VRSLQLQVAVSMVHINNYPATWTNNLILPTSRCQAKDEGGTHSVTVPYRQAKGRRSSIDIGNRKGIVSE